MIGIIDYGLGNIKAFYNVYKKLNIPAAIVQNSDQLRQSDKIILPGVGSFDSAMQKLELSGMRPTLDEIVNQQQTPVMGICVGMQILAHSSEEGNLPGLGWIAGKVKKLKSQETNLPVAIPHMGWNNIMVRRRHDLLDGLGDDSRFYFLHSYYFACRRDDQVLAYTDYGGQFASVVYSGNIFGVQFHPEKSHQWGIRLLENFSKV